MVAQNIGAGLWDRVSKITRSGILYSVLITTALVVLMTLADKSVMALFMGADSPALPIARHIHVVATWNFILFGITMVLFATVRANGAVWAPLVILCIGLVPVRFGFILGTDQWLGADAIWWSFPVSSFANVALSIAYYLQGGWKKARMMAPAPADEEMLEEALGTREPGGALRPAG
jgi:Na+-driven multidrug efflux pump